MQSTKEGHIAEKLSVASTSIELFVASQNRTGCLKKACVSLPGVTAVTIWAGSNNFKLAQPARAGSGVGSHSWFFFVFLTTSLVSR